MRAEGRGESDSSVRIYMAPTADCMNPSFSDTLFGISSTYKYGHTLFQTKNVSHAEVPNVNIKSGQAYVESSLSFCEESDDLKNAWNQSHTHSTHTQAHSKIKTVPLPGKACRANSRKEQNKIRGGKITNLKHYVRAKEKIWIKLENLTRCCSQRYVRVRRWCSACTWSSVWVGTELSWANDSNPFHSLRLLPPFARRQKLTKRTNTYNEDG